MLELSSTKAPKVSVCLVTYQQEALIAQTIESVVTQRTSFDVELVIGEDASTDRTREIVAECARRSPMPLRLIRQQVNRGLVSNFVDAFHACRGDYVALLDGDDFWTDSDKLQKQANLLDQYSDCSMCFHNVAVELRDGAMWEWNYTANEQEPFTTIETLLEINPFATSSAMVRRSALPRLPPWFPDLIWHDWSLYMLLAERGRIAYLAEVMGVYRNHGTGLWSGLKLVEQIQRKIAFLESMNEHLEHRYSASLSASIAKYRSELALLQSADDGYAG